MWKKVLFVTLAVASLTPWISAPVALLGGIGFALFLGNPDSTRSKTWATRALQASVVGLGAGMDLSVVARVGVQGLGQTLLGLTVTLTLALLLAKLLRTEATTSLLIGVGTAICGGSAIAAVAPAIGAKSHQTSVSLSVVFLLNAVALVVFPKVGALVGLEPAPFGLWSALAIHDTSSVVGASMAMGPVALAVGTTVKLARALWILPVALVLARVWKHPEGTPGAKPKTPWFIFGFIAVAAVVTFVPGLKDAGQYVAVGARHVLVATLFLIGAGVSREALKTVGVRPLLLGVLLWVIVGSVTLWAIASGLLTVPSMG